MTDRDFASKSWLHPEREDLSVLEFTLLITTCAFGITLGIVLMHFPG